MRNDWIAWCYAREPTGELLVQDFWLFNHRYGIVRRLWRQVQEWNSQFANDPDYRWFIAPRPNNF